VKFANDFSHSEVVFAFVGRISFSPPRTHKTIIKNAANHH